MRETGSFQHVKYLGGSARSTHVAVPLQNFGGLIELPGLERRLQNAHMILAGGPDLFLTETLLVHKTLQRP